MDFFVADPDSEDEAKEIMSRGTKEYSVMISSDELEKMAADEDYYNKNINTIDDAVKKSKEINEKFGAESDYGKENGVGISQIGIKVNADGTTSYFVELEKFQISRKNALKMQKKSVQRRRKSRQQKPRRKPMCRQIHWKSLKRKSKRLTGIA